MSTEPPEYEHGGEYQSDAFGAPDSLDDLKGEGAAVGCLLIYAMIVIVVLAELLRYATGSAKWWPVLIAVPFFLPRIWSTFRLWQSPQLLDGPRVKGLSFREKRFWLVAVVVAMIVEFELQLLWPTIRDFFDSLW